MADISAFLGVRVVLIEVNMAGDAEAHDGRLSVDANDVLAVNSLVAPECSSKAG